MKLRIIFGCASCYGYEDIEGDVRMGEMTHLPGSRLDVDSAPPVGQCALHSQEEVHLVGLLRQRFLTQAWTQMNDFTGVFFANTQIFMLKQESVKKYAKQHNCKNNLTTKLFL